MLTKNELIEPLLPRRGNAVVVTTMGIVRPWGTRSASELDFASADSAMGHAADLALGIALACPDRRVICLNGDGSMLMTLGTLATAVHARARNYVLFVLQNGSYEITGNQRIPAGSSLDFGLIARGSGFAQVYSFDQAAPYRDAIPEILRAEGPVFVSVRIEPGSEGPLSRSSSESSPYLTSPISDSAHRLRKILATDLSNMEKGNIL